MASAVEHQCPAACARWRGALSGALAYLQLGQNGRLEKVDNVNHLVGRCGALRRRPRFLGLEIGREGPKAQCEGQRRERQGSRKGAGCARKQQTHKRDDHEDGGVFALPVLLGVCAVLL